MAFFFDAWRVAFEENVRCASAAIWAVMSGGDRLLPREGYLSAGLGRLYYREIGAGPVIVVLHGGPDFDHTYLVPEMDTLAASFRLIYYDQRGRGRSAERVGTGDVTLGSEMEDLERVRRHFGLRSMAVLGHSWGGLLAMEYATRHPERVTHVILMNTAPASVEDAETLRARLRETRTPGEEAELERLRSTSRYQQGELDADAEYYRIHFRGAFRQRHLLEQLVSRLRSNFTPSGVVLARAIEERLYDETWQSHGYDLTRRLEHLAIPTLVLHGSEDFIPVELAGNIAQVIPDAILRVLPGCGHFAYMERPDEVHTWLTKFLGRA